MFLVFIHSGRHTSTKSLLTDSTMISFLYDEKGRLRRLVNSGRSSIDVKYQSGNNDLAEIWINGRQRVSAKADLKGRLERVTMEDGREFR